MEIVTLVCCGLNFVLLVVLLIKAFGKKTDNKEITELRNQLEVLKQTSSADNSRLMEQSVRQGESAVNQIIKLGENLSDSQNRQQTRTSEILDKINIEMKELRRENQQSLEKINGIVTEKMQKMLDEKLNGAFETVVQNMAQLGKMLSDSQDKQQKITAEKLERLENNFEVIRKEINSTLINIRDSNSTSMEKLRRENQASLDKINDTVNEKLQKTLDERVAKSFEMVNSRLEEVHKGLGEMKTVAAGVSDLKNVLSNVKTRGTLGEIQLGGILSEILAPEQYGEQICVNPGSSEKVDFAVKLPGSERAMGKENSECVYLPIDSKFPGDTYANLIDAYNSGDSELLKSRRKLLETEILRCAKSIRDKYINPPYTTNFAIMFLPSEGLYAEVVNMGMIERLQRDYSINIAGPSTMAAMLNSLQMGFKTLAIQKKSGEVWKILESAKKEFSTFESVLSKTRERLRQADEELEKLVGTRTNQINRKLAAISLPDSDNENLQLTN